MNKAQLQKAEPHFRELRKLMDTLNRFGNVLVLHEEGETIPAKERLSFLVNKLRDEHGLTLDEIESGIKNLDASEKVAGANLAQPSNDDQWKKSCERLVALEKERADKLEEENERLRQEIAKLIQGLSWGISATQEDIGNRELWTEEEELLATMHADGLQYIKKQLQALTTAK